MITSGNQNQFPSSFAPFGDLLKTLMFFSNLNGFNSSPSLPDQGFARLKGSSKVWKENGSKWFYHFLLSLRVFVFAQLVCFAFILSQSSFMLCFALLNIFLFVYFQFCLFCFSYKNQNQNWKIKKIQKQCMLCVHWYLCTLDGHWNKVF